MLPIIWAVALHSTLFVSGYECSIVGNCEVRVGPDSMVAAEWLCFVSSIFFELNRAEVSNTISTCLSFC